MSQRTESIRNWSGIIALIGLLITVVTGAVKLGHRDAAIDQKLEKAVYQQDQTQLERRLGELQGDVRVIRSAVCRRDPSSCR